MSVKENKDIARRWNDEIWSKGNLAVIDELLATDFVFNYPTVGAVPDREGYKKTISEMFGPLEDVHSTIKDMVAEGDKIAVRWTWRGTHNKGEYMGITPTGKQMTITGISILRIISGKIVEEWGEMDNLGFMKQFGLLPPLDQDEN